jgi:hypothetical protein
MWSNRPRPHCYPHPLQPSSHPGPPHTEPVAGPTRRPARTRLVVPLSLGLACLLGGWGEARAEQRISVQVDTAQNASPTGLSVEANAVPGKRNQGQWTLTCSVYPPTGWCEGGYLVANFNANQGQRVVRAWTSHQRGCVVNDYYIACGMDPMYNTEQQAVFFELDVEPWSYTDNHGSLQGSDGFPLPPTQFTIRMTGQGELHIGQPADVVVPETAGMTTMHFVNDGPSTNRRVMFRFGPFPSYLAPRMLNPDMPCTLSPDRVLVCGPVDQPPDSRGALMLAVQAIPPLPRVPDLDLIDVVATSDLTPSLSTDFLVHIVSRPQSP